MADVTQILSQIEQGDPSAAEQLLPLVYDELRKLAAAKMAHERPGQTLQATALVHDAYLRLVDTKKSQHWDSRGHFFAAAAEAMRRILVELARKRRSVKHGGQLKRLCVDDLDVPVAMPSDNIIEIHEALEIFEKIDRDAAALVKLRYFAGLTIPQTAEALGVSSSTADRHWAYARAWLHAYLKDEGADTAD